MRRLVVLVALCGCHPSPSPVRVVAPIDEPAAVTPVVEPPRSSVKADPPRPCDGLDGVIVNAPSLDLQCEDGHRRCSGTASFTVRNCSPGDVDFVDLQIRQDEQVLTFAPAESRLGSGAAWTKTSELLREGNYAVAATLRVDGVIVTTESVALSIRNPARDAAIVACEQCNGQWGRWGMSGAEACNCSTADGGNICRDGNECEAGCIFERFEVVRTASRTCNADGSCVVSPELGRPVGRCSTSTMKFGCHPRVKRGASNDPAVRLPARAPMVCVD